MIRPLESVRVGCCTAVGTVSRILRIYGETLIVSSFSSLVLVKHLVHETDVESLEVTNTGLDLENVNPSDCSPETSVVCGGRGFHIDCAYDLMSGSHGEMSGL